MFSMTQAVKMAARAAAKAAKQAAADAPPSVKVATAVSASYCTVVWAKETMYPFPSSTLSSNAFRSAVDPKGCGASPCK